MQLNLNDDETKILILALDLFSRISCGQLNEIAYKIRYKRMLENKNFTPQILNQIDYYLDDLKQVLFPELNSSSSYSILSNEVPKSAKIAYDILKKIGY
jgi:hypothetical protein